MTDVTRFPIPAAASFLPRDGVARLITWGGRRSAALVVDSTAGW